MRPGWRRWDNKPAEIKSGLYGHCGTGMDAEQGLLVRHRRGMDRLSCGNRDHRKTCCCLWENVCSTHAHTYTNTHKIVVVTIGSTDDNGMTSRITGLEITELKST